VCVSKPLNWLAGIPAVQTILQTKIEIENPETGHIQAVIPDSRFTTPFAHFTADRIQKAQRSNHDYVNIIEKLTDQKVIKPHLSRYTLIIGILLARIKNKHLPLNRTNLAIVLPRPDITKLIGACHVINHFGTKKLTQLVQKCFYNKDTKKIA
jgi:hypothetical protein